ncbi:MAG: hypothetical protein IBX48_04930 [Thiomicrospira sp.]|uniref:complex I subunit 5 family protein n=1 Tax=Thiomicrospira sp. TaxID=935 RepID=UPI0019E46C69|nr:complex I subunit 5 family protein [Thiomicrospira sp.]MBE0493667.1 hypothetical protein [Thiomicrospira sp.]
MMDFSGMLAMIWLWPLLFALGLAWPRLRPYGIKLLPWALLPAGLLWFGFGWQLLADSSVTLKLEWPNILVGTRLNLDRLGFVWLSLSLIVWGVAALHSRWVQDVYAWRYALFFLLSLAGSLGLVVAADAVSFYLTFSLMSLAAWGLVIHERHASAQRAARWYILLAILGELWLFVGIVARAAELGTTDLSIWAQTSSAGWGLALIWLGLAVKIGVPILHIWLPLAHPAAPVPASAVLSGVMIKAGIIGWWLLLPSQAMANNEWLWLMPWLGVATMLFGGVLGLMQTDPKALLAYSSISQMGWLIWGIGWVWQSAQPEWMMLWVAAFAFHHALIKAGLFLAVGWVKFSATQARWMPWVWGMVILLALLLAGLPFSSGALLKAEMKQVSADALYQLPDSLLLAGSVITGLLMIQFVRRLARLEVQPKTLEKPALISWFSLVGLALIWPYAFMTPSWDNVLSDTQPLLIAVVFATAWRIRVNRQVHLAPGDGVVWLEAAGVKISQLKKHQAWWLKQQQYLVYWRLKSQQKLRRFSKRIYQAERFFLNWSNYVTWLGALLLLVGLSQVF